MSGPDDTGLEPEEDATRIVRSVSPTGATPAAPAEDVDSTVPPVSAAPPLPTQAPPPQPPPIQGGGASRSSARMMPGQILGHTYEIEAHLARGGMGEVYRARHIELGSLHAIKVILPELAEDPKIISLFQEEARKLSRVRNDAIVAYEGLFRDENGVRYLVMEFVDGTSLSRVIRQGPLPVEAVRRLRDRCAMGLAAAHEKRIFHRDIAPDNILLVGNQPDPGDKTIIGQDFAGKYSYVSPEQLGLHGGLVDGRSDIYSLGLVLVAAAAGRALDMGNSPVSVIEARRAVPDLGSIPEELRAELAPLLEPNPADRPQSMRELPGSGAGMESTGWRQGIAAGGPEPVRLPAAQPKAAPEPKAKPPGSQPLGAEKSGGGKKGLAIAAAIGAFLLVVAGGAFFLFSGRPASSPVATNPPAAGPEPAPVPAPTQIPTQTQAPVAPPPQAAISLPALQAALGELPCASVKASATAAGGVAMAGFVGGAEDLQQLTRIAQNAGATSTTTTAVKVYQEPLCEIAKLFDDEPRFAEAPKAVIDFNDSSRLYHDGAKLVVTITAPTAGGYLYVDYFDSGGAVVHMLPTSSVPRNQIAPNQTMTLGTLDDTLKANQDAFIVGEPYGLSMIVATIASRPLFERVRPPQEKASDYLKELKHRLMVDHAGASSPLVAAGYQTFDVER